MTECKRDRDCRDHPDRVHAQRHAGVGARRPPAPARRAARGARRHVAEGRLLAVGAVRLLHGARRRQGGRQLQPRSLDKVAGKDGRHAGGRRRRRAAIASPSAFAACGGLQCGFCIPGIVMRAKSQIDKKGADLDRRGDGAAPRRPPVPLHRLRQDPRRHRGGRQGQDVRAGARRRRRRVRRQVRGGASWRSATAATSTTSACRACSTPPCTSPPTPAPTSSPSTPAAAAAADGVVAVFTAADIPGELRVGIIHKDWPVMIPVGGRTSYAGDVLADRRRRDPPAGAGRGRAGRGRATTCSPPVTDPLAAIEPGAAARRVGHRRQRAVA